MALSPVPTPSPFLIQKNSNMMKESAKEPKLRLIEVRDWKTSKYPLRLIIRGIFLTYMWSAMWQVSNHLECKRELSLFYYMFSFFFRFRYESGSEKT